MTDPSLDAPRVTTMLVHALEATVPSSGITMSAAKHERPNVFIGGVPKRCGPSRAGYLVPTSGQDTRINQRRRHDNALHSQAGYLYVLLTSATVSGIFIDRSTKWRPR